MYYFFQVILCSGLLMGYYWLVLRNKRFHQYNRFYLLAVALLSWIVPLIKIRWTQNVIGPDQQVARLLSVVADGNTQIEEIVKGRGSALSWGVVVAAVYILVAAVLLTGIIRALYRLYRLLQVHSCKTVGDIYLIFTQAKGTPFSFFRYIFWNDEIDIRSESGKQILEHELTHVKEKHSYDKLFIQLMLVVGWFNPFFWLLKKEMEMIHEFIADKKAVANGDTASLAEMLLTTVFPQQQYRLTHPFFFSPVKRRLQMLTNTSHPRFTYIRRLIVLPLLAVMVILFSFRNKESGRTTISLATVVDHVIDNPTASLMIDHVDRLLLKPVNGNRDSVRLFADTIMVHDGNGLIQKAYGNITIADKGESGLLGEALIVVNGTKADHTILETVHPDDIDRIDILKDRAAVDRYGDAGKNGVVLITTKNKAALQKTDLPQKSIDLYSLHGAQGSIVNFQAIARDIMGNVAGNRTVYIKDRILRGSDQGEVIWEETHKVKTDAQGVYAVMIGAGNKVEAFANKQYTGIDWNQGPFFFNLNDAIVPADAAKQWVPEDNYVDRGTTKMWHIASVSLKDLSDPVNSSLTSYSQKGEDVTLPANRISEITMAAPGFKKGDPIVISPKYNSPDWSVRAAWVKEDGKVKVTFNNPTKNDIKLSAEDYAITRIQYPGSQPEKTSPVEMETNQEQDPAQFPGGEIAWQKYLERNLNRELPAKNGAPPGHFTVTVSFIVNTEGMLSDVRAENDPGYGTKAEAIRIIEKGPKWKPATVNGKAVVYRAKKVITWEVTENGQPSVLQVQEPARFPGGEPAWEQYLKRNLNKDIVTQQGGNPGKYEVVVSFIVDKEGKISNINAENDPGYGTKAEAIRMIAKGPKWVPAKLNGKPVIYRQKQTISWEVKEKNPVNLLKSGKTDQTDQASVRQAAFEQKLAKAKEGNTRIFFNIDGRSCVTGKGGSAAWTDGLTDIVIVNGKRITPDELNRQYKRSDFIVLSSKDLEKPISKAQTGILLVSSRLLSQDDISKQMALALR